MSGKSFLGEFIDISSSQSSIGVVTGLFSLAVFFIYALIQTDAENDDDDSNSGGDGGLMQPVT